jgi:glycosyltransferase involved in cell wall biosynthesis
MPQKMLSYKTDSFYCKGEVADAKKFIADKKILIVPLRSGSGIRVKTLEAMAAKKLVVTTSIGIQGINAVDKKHILLANTPKEFAKAIAWVFQYLEEAEQIAQNGQNLVNTHYNATILTQSYLNFIQKLS